MSDHKIRQFGLLFTVIGIGLIGLLYVPRDYAAGLIILLVTLFFAIGIEVTRLLRPLYRVWMGLALVIGAIVSTVLLSVIYYLLMTPIGLLMRLFGKDPMSRNIDPSAKSYWVVREKESNIKERLEQLF